MSKVPPRSGRRQRGRDGCHPARRLVTLIFAAGIGVPVFASIQTVLPLPVAIFSAVAAAAIAYLQVFPGDAA